MRITISAASKLIISCLILVSCSRQKTIKKITENGFYEIGSVINDSVFHGVVKRYNANDEYVGYGTYWHGIKNGFYINSYGNGSTKDSIMFRFERKNGFSFSFDSLGKLSYKVNFIDGRPVGKGKRVSEKTVTPT